MNEVNQLILDCLARVLRINQTTDAEISFEFAGYINAVSCYGYKLGYANTVVEQNEEYPNADYSPLTSCTGSAYGCIYLDGTNTESELKKLLASLDALEKELINAK